MHKTAYNNAKLFYEQYCSNNIENKNILDVGSWDGGNGNLRTIFGKGKYVGLDVQYGPNVDVTYTDIFPFDDNSFDIIISSSCFEHVEFFWDLFLEMSRVLKVDGYIYICAPSTGPYHPQQCVSDSWRFYPDSWRSLTRWANKNNYNITLLQSYLDHSHIPPDENWIDSVGIFRKSS